jgi:hypothetical protein
VASSEAPDVIHQAMRPASYRLTCMAIKIASDSPAFFVVVDSFFAHVMVNIKNIRVTNMFISMLLTYLYCLSTRR